MKIHIEENEIEALKWLLLKGMEITNSDRKYEIFESLNDRLKDPEEEQDFEGCEDSVKWCAYCGEGPQLNGKDYCKDCAPMAGWACK